MSQSASQSVVLIITKVLLTRQRPVSSLTSCLIFVVCITCWVMGYQIHFNLILDRHWLVCSSFSFSFLPYSDNFYYFPNSRRALLSVNEGSWSVTNVQSKENILPKEFPNKQQNFKLLWFVFHNEGKEYRYISRFELGWIFVVACEKNVFICMQSQNLKNTLYWKSKWFLENVLFYDSLYSLWVKGSWRTLLLSPTEG